MQKPESKIEGGITINYLGVNLPIVDLNFTQIIPVQKIDSVRKDSDRRSSY